MPLVKAGDVRLIVATEDGSAGYKGFITEALEREIKSGAHFDVIYSCGPIGMFNSLHRVGEKWGIQTFGSLETQMGCGFGVCLGCSIETRASDSSKRFDRVCTEGPIFDLATVVWDRLVD